LRALDRAVQRGHRAAHALVGQDVGGFVAVCSGHRDPSRGRRRNGGALRALQRESEKAEPGSSRGRHADSSSSTTRSDGVGSESGSSTTNSNHRGLGFSERSIISPGLTTTAGCAYGKIRSWLPLYRYLGIPAPYEVIH